jgi:homoserine O-acetyltransferase
MKTSTTRSSAAFLLASGRELPADSMQIKYATWGDPSNPAILICPSMSQSAFAADMPDEENNVTKGWWRQIVGAGDHYGIDTRRFYVISGAPLGSPFGSTSPLTTNPETGEPFGPHFPQITPADMAATQALLLDHLNVKNVLAVVGGSMGGMQALQFGAMFPDR